MPDGLHDKRVLQDQVPPAAPREIGSRQYRAALELRRYPPSSNAVICPPRGRTPEGAAAGDGRPLTPDAGHVNGCIKLPLPKYYGRRPLSIERLPSMDAYAAFSRQLLPIADTKWNCDGPNNHSRIRYGQSYSPGIGPARCLNPNLTNKPCPGQ